MNHEMLAALDAGGGRYTVRSLPLPERFPGSVLIRVRQTGICGTDLHAALERTEPEAFPGGHEIAGEILELAPDGGVDASGAPLHVGDRVAIPFGRLLGRACGARDRRNGWQAGNASARHPVVLVFHNLHWADRPSILLLTFLAENLGAARVLVIGTYRHDALTRSHPLSSALADLTREASPVRVRLRGLEKDDIERFLEFATGAPGPSGLADAVHGHTEGNPLFASEVIRWLSERGDIRTNNPGGGARQLTYLGRSGHTS